MKFLKAIDKNGERWLLLVFYTMIVITVSVEVLRRFILSYSSLWGEEIARYSFVYLAWIACALAVRERGHIRIDFLLQYMPDRISTCFYIFGDVASLLLAGIAFYWSFDPILTSIKFGSVTHGLQISLAWFLAAVPLGFGMITLRLCQSIHRDWQNLKAGRPAFRGERIFD